MLKCTECNEEISRQEKLTDHFQIFHAGSSPINPEPAQQKCTEDEHNKFRCNTCEEVFDPKEDDMDESNGEGNETKLQRVKMLATLQNKTWLSLALFMTLYKTIIVILVIK